MDNRSRIPELLAPVGEFAALEAAIASGADAVFFGLDALSMRASTAQRFTLDDVDRIASRARDAGIPAYLTLNTVSYDEERDLLKRIAEKAAEAGVAAAIVSDPAVLRACAAAGLPVHLSTQLSISNLEAVRFWAPYADRMVLARELSLEQVAGIVDGIAREAIRGPSGRLVEIELFAHGALCVAVSGRCHMSLYLHNKSGNRGDCLQPCRRAYRVTDVEEGRELEIDNHLVMSPRDLCTLPFLDRLAGTGVRSLKLEGRTRSPEYVAVVTSCYRRALDALAAGTWDAPLADSLMSELATVYNRGFSSGFYLGYTGEQWAASHGSQARKRKVYSAKVTNYFAKSGVAEALVESAPLSEGTELLVIGPTSGVVRFALRGLRIDGVPAECAGKGALASFAVPQKVRENDRVYLFEDAIPMPSKNDATTSEGEKI